ncbi:MAG: hypothetical protein WBV55_11850 [Candidatus Sulfotelmatobacter sp.]
MRRLLIVVAALAFCSATTWADSIELDVSAWATFTGTQPCSSSCTETIGVNFLYTEPTGGSSTAGIFGTVGPITVSASGFLGTFSPYPAQVPTQGEIGFTNFQGDEIDLNGFEPLTGIQEGINTLYFDLFFCRSSACDNAYGPDATPMHPNPTSESSVATRVAVPDETSFLSLVLTALGAMGLVWRWRRKEASEA